MISLAKFLGGAVRYGTLSTTKALWPGHPRVIRVATSGGTPKVRMPDATKLQTGGVLFAISNEGPASVTLEDYAGSSIRVLATGYTADMLLIRNTSQAGLWFALHGVTGSATSVYRDPGRSDILDEPAKCLASQYMGVRCDDPTRVWFSNDPALAAHLGKVVLIDTKCYRVYSIRNSGQHPTNLPPIDDVFDDCADCGATGDADDSNLDPLDIIVLSGNGTTLSDSSKTFES